MTHHALKIATASVALVLTATLAPHTPRAAAAPSDPLPSSEVSASTQATAPASPSVPLTGLSEDYRRVQGELDEATARAIELEDEIEALEADRLALAERVGVTADRIRRQRTEVEAAQARLDEARTRYRGRLVEVYKRGAVDPLSILLTADTISDFFARASVLTRLAEDDGRIVSDLSVAAADAAYQVTQLEELMAQDRELQRVLDERATALTRARAQQEQLVAKLTAEAREALAATRRLNAQTRSQWQSSSVPLGTQIPRATATVDPYAGLTYVCSAYMPRTYRSTGTSWTAVCSWYGPGFHGRTTASGQVFNENDLTCASRTLPFGTVLALTRGERRVIVYVNDRGPFIAGRDLDLSKAAAQALGFGGVASVHAEVIVPVGQ